MTPPSAGLPPPPTSTPKPVPVAKSKLAGLLLLVLTAAIPVEGYFLNDGWGLVAIVLTLGLFLVVIGQCITGHTLGALINAQNIMSLSRFQMTAWTIVVIASYASYALVRIKGGADEPLNIGVDVQLIAMMGISAASFIGSPFILGTKKDKEPKPESTVKTATKGGESLHEIENNREGILYANTNMEDARLTDLFQGDEIGNTLHIDLAKVQMFFFTVIVALGYLARVFQTLRAPETLLWPTVNLPEISNGIVVALGISHAGYLSSKAIDHTPVQK